MSTPDQTTQQITSVSPPASPQQPPAPARSLRQQYSDWPQKGDTRPQPWDLDTLQVPKVDRELEAGAPNTVSPVVIRHSMPILTSGMAGSAVSELARRLQTLGYQTDISQGRNFLTVLTDDVMRAVERFCEDYGVREDPTAFGGNTESARTRAARHVGPYIWEALIRASERALEQAA